MIQTSSTDKDDREKRSRTVDILMFCGLVINPSLLWIGPNHTLLLGGVYFLVPYILMYLFFAFPLIHLEIFVGQRHQCSIFAIFRRYGWAFQGIGALITLLIFVESSNNIEFSYVAIEHVKNVIHNVTEIVSCRSESYQGYDCASLYDDIECKQLYDRNFHYQFGRCTNVTQNRRFLNAGHLYFNDFVAEKFGQHIAFNVNAMFYYFAMFSAYGVISLGGERILRILLAILYVGFIISLLINLVVFVSAVDYVVAAEIFWMISTPESIYSYNMYKEVFSLVIKNCGALFYGLMSAASLRGKNKSTYDLAFGIVLNDILVSVISSIIAIYITAFLTMNSYNGFEFTPRRSRFRFFLITSLDVILAKGGGVFLSFICNLTYILVLYPRFVGPILEVCSISRVFKKHQLPIIIVGTTTVCICGFLLAVVRCYRAFILPYRQLTAFIEFTTGLPLMAASVVILFHVYGKREYHMDLCDLYPEDGKYSTITNLLSSVHFFTYDIMPFVFCFFALTDMAKVFSDEKVINIPCLLVIIAIILGFFFTSFCELAKRNELYKLFSITSQHPSYNRLNYMELLEFQDDILKAYTSKLSKERIIKGSLESMKTAPSLEETDIQQFGSTEQTTIKTKSTEGGSIEKISMKTESQRLRRTSSAEKQSDESKRKVETEKERVTGTMKTTSRESDRNDEKGFRKGSASRH